MSNALYQTLAIIATIFNGSFPCILKFEAATRIAKNNIMATLWMTLGIFISSLIIMQPLSQIKEINFTPDYSLEQSGIMSGIILLSAFHCTVIAIEQLDLTLAITIWSGTSILVSIVWGLLQNKYISNYISLIAGILSILFALVVLSQMRDIVEPKDDLELENEQVKLSSHFSSNHGRINHDESNNKTSLIKQSIGILAAIMTGVMGGSVQASKILLRVIKPDYKVRSDFNFIQNMSLSSFITSLVVYFIYLSRRRDRFNWEQFSADQLLSHAMSGLFQNLGNILITFVLNQLSQSIAYGIFQCSLIVGVLWGLFYQKEFDGQYKLKYMILTFIMIVMVVCGFICISLGINDK